MTLTFGWFQRPRSRFRAQSQRQPSVRINRREKDGGKCQNKIVFLLPRTHGRGGGGHEPARKGQQQSLFFRVSSQCVSSKCVNGEPGVEEIPAAERSIGHNVRGGRSPIQQKFKERRWGGGGNTTTSILLLKPAESKHGWDGDISPQQ